MCYAGGTTLKWSADTATDKSCTQRCIAHLHQSAIEVNTSQYLNPLHCTALRLSEAHHLSGRTGRTSCYGDNFSDLQDNLSLWASQSHYTLFSWLSHCCEILKTFLQVPWSFDSPHCCLFSLFPTLPLQSSQGTTLPRILPTAADIFWNIASLKKHCTGVFKISIPLKRERRVQVMKLLVLNGAGAGLTG